VQGGNPKRFELGTKVRVTTTGVVGIVVEVGERPIYNGEYKHTIRYAGGDVTAPGSKLEPA